MQKWSGPSGLGVLYALWQASAPHVRRRRVLLCGGSPLNSSLFAARKIGFVTVMACHRWRRCAARDIWPLTIPDSMESLELGKLQWPGCSRHFFKGQCGSLVRPDTFDDGSLAEQNCKKVKSFTDVGNVEPMSKKRRGAAPWVKEQARIFPA